MVEELRQVEVARSEPEDMIEVELEDEFALEGDRDECDLESGDVFVSVL